MGHNTYMDKAFVEFVNGLELEPIDDNPQYVRLWDTSLEDGSGVEVFVGLRIDTRWVSIADAVTAVRNTFLIDLIADNKDPDDDIADVLVTRNMRGEVEFDVLTGQGKDFTVPSHGRHRA